MKAMSFSRELSEDGGQPSSFAAMCDTCHSHGHLSPETIVCRATDAQLMRLLRDILKAERRPDGSTK
jgi:hypothetical protein